MKENIWPAVYVTSIETRLKKGQSAINKRKSDSQKRATISPPPSAKKKKHAQPQEKSNNSVSKDGTDNSDSDGYSSVTKTRKLPHKQQKVQAKVQEKDQQIKVLPNLCYRTHGLIQGIIGMPRR